MARCQTKYTTLLDLARQAKIISGNTACFDGKIQAGIPFSGYPTGVDLSTVVNLGIVSQEDAVLSGSSATTIFDVSNSLSPNYDPIFEPYSGDTWTNPLFSAHTVDLTLPITVLSAETQEVGPIWTLTQTGMTGDHEIGLEYTGYTIQYSFYNIVDIGTTVPLYTGFTTPQEIMYSAGTLDYKGPLDYLRSREDATVDNRLTTKKLRVTGGASASTIGYVLTQVDEIGSAEWVFNSASATTNTFVTSGVLSGSDLELTYNTGGSVPPIDLSALSGDPQNLQNVLEQGTIGPTFPFTTSDSVGVLPAGYNIALGTGDPFTTPPTTATTLTWFDGVKGTIEMGGFDVSSSSGSNGAVNLNAQNQLGVSHVDVSGGFIDISTTGSTIMLEADGNILIEGLGELTNPSVGDVLSAKDSAGRLKWVTPFSITGITSGDCITDLYVSNIHSCSPLNINPLDEGNVYFGSDSGVTIDLGSDKKVGIGTVTPVERLTVEDGNILTLYDRNNTSFISVKNFNTGVNARASLHAVVRGEDGIDSSGVFCMFGSGYTGTAGFSGEYLPNSLTLATGGGADAQRAHVNIGSRRTDGQIRFFTGDENYDNASLLGIWDPTGLILSGSSHTSHLNTDTIQVRNGAIGGYVLTATDSDGNASWQASSGGGTFTGNTSGDCVEALWVSNISGCTGEDLHIGAPTGDIIFDYTGDTSAPNLFIKRDGLIGIGTNTPFDGTWNGTPAGIEIRMPDVNDNIALAFSETGSRRFYFVTDFDTLYEPVHIYGGPGPSTTPLLTFYTNDVGGIGGGRIGMGTVQPQGCFQLSLRGDVANQTKYPDEVNIVINNTSTGWTGSTSDTPNSSAFRFDHLSSEKPGGLITSVRQPEWDSGIYSTNLEIWNASGGTLEKRIEILASWNTNIYGDIRVIGKTDSGGSSNSQFQTDLDYSDGPIVRLTGDTTGLVEILTGSEDQGLSIGCRGDSEPIFINYGKQGDGFLYSSAEQNGLNIISSNGTGTEDYIKFFAGQTASPANTPDIIIVGSGITKGYVGIGIEEPTEKLHLKDGDILIENGTTIYSDLSSPTLPKLLLSGTSATLAQIGVTNPQTAGLGIGYRGETEPSFDGYGKQGDGFLYSSAASNGLNIISQQGTGKDDYIRFYAGNSTGAAPANTPDIHIQGSGATRGNVGINTKTPTEKLHIEGSVRIVDGTEQNGYVLTSDANGVGSWEPVTGSSCCTLQDTFNEGTVLEPWMSGILTTNSVFASLSAETIYIGTGVTGSTPDEFAAFVMTGDEGTTGYPSRQIQLFTKVDGTGDQDSGKVELKSDHGGLLAELWLKKGDIHLNATNLGTPNNGDILRAKSPSGTIEWADPSSLPSSTFTGNTSGTCIDLLWVSTISGCSPVTIGSSVQAPTCNASGLHSFAYGSGTTASGISSHAEGSYTIASNTGAHAEGGFWGEGGGIGTRATGISSHAEGAGTVASGDACHAEGFSTTASTGTSHAEGSNTHASASSSHAEGDATIASEARAHAEGWGTEASGIASHAEGRASVASGLTAHAEGSYTVAGNFGSHAEGAESKAFGVASHAEGASTQAIGGQSHSEGQSTIARGDNSHAEGFGVESIGSSSHAEGFNTEATGDYSHSEGFMTTASGSTSHAQGQNTIAAGVCSHAGGYGHALGIEVLSTGLSSFAHFHLGETSVSKGVAGDYSAILGGRDHSIGSDNTDSVIIGGQWNNISGHSGTYNSIMGGINNVIGNHSGVGSDPLNRSVIIGGQVNGIECTGGVATDNAIISSFSSTMSLRNAQGHVIIGGNDHDITTSGRDANAIIGGISHNISGENSAIIGGDNNTIGAGFTNSVIIGGNNITATSGNTVFMPNVDLCEFGGILTVSNVESCSPLRINTRNQGNIYFGEEVGLPLVTIDILTPKEPGIYFGPDSFIRWEELQKKLVIGDEEADGKVVIEVENDEIVDVTKEKTKIVEGDLEAEDGNIIVKSGNSKTVIIEDIPDVSGANLGTDLDGKVIDIPSDTRVKRDIKDIPGLVDPLEFLSNVKGYQFKWKPESRIGDPTKVHYGFKVDEFRDDLINTGGQSLSQPQHNVNEIAKSMVDRTKRKFMFDTNTQPQHVDKMNYEDLIPFMVEGIKSLNVNMTNLSSVSSGGVKKYVNVHTLTKGNTETITHNLNEADVIVQLLSESGEMVIPERVSNYLSNSVEIDVSVTSNYKIIIMG